MAVQWWVRHGIRREMGLGGYPVVTLAKAWSKATDCRMAISEATRPDS